MAKPAGDNPFNCSVCGDSFSLPKATLDKYPNWKPTKCPGCFKKNGPASSQRKPRKKASPPPATGPLLTIAPPPDDGPLVQPVTSPDLEQALEEALEQYNQGPNDGLFTDGACSGNPGPGGWGAVWVEEGRIVGRAYGRDAPTTNNRMELMGLIAGFRMLAPDQPVTIWSDSKLCVDTINTWAAGWARRGWKRKGGPVKNLELVQEAYALSLERPRAVLKWIKAHNGARWNEYADRLATIPL